jgi:hypothetical protein
LIPAFVTWTALALMDGPMTVFVGAGLVAWRHGRLRTAAVLLLVAVWTKETAFVVVLVMTAWALLQDGSEARSVCDRRA